MLDIGIGPIGTRTQNSTVFNLCSALPIDCKVVCLIIFAMNPALPVFFFFFQMQALIYRRVVGV
jgi:hypothetical protein